MQYRPLKINITGQQILIIGAGKVALHKIEGLERFTRSIKVIAPLILDEIRARNWIEIVEKPYDASDLKGHLLVYATTDNPGLNSRIAEDALRQGCLVNVVDNPSRGQFISPAIYKRGYMTVAVSSNGKDVKSSVLWRNRIRQWVELDILTSLTAIHNNN